MAIYNTSFMENTTNLLDLAVGLNNVSTQSYVLGYLILFSFFIIVLFYSNKKEDISAAFIIAGMLTTTLAGLLFAAGLVPVSAIAYPFVVLVLAIVFTFVLS